MELAAQPETGSISKRLPQGEIISHKTRKIVLVSRGAFSGYSNLAESNSGFISDVSSYGILIPATNTQLTACSQLYDFIKIKRVNTHTRFIPFATNWTSTVDGSQYTDPTYHGFVMGGDADSGFTGNHTLPICLERYGSKMVEGTLFCSFQWVPSQVSAGSPMAQLQWYDISSIHTFTFGACWFAHLFFTTGTAQSTQNVLVIHEIECELAGNR